MAVQFEMLKFKFPNRESIIEKIFGPVQFEKIMRIALNRKRMEKGAVRSIQKI